MPAPEMKNDPLYLLLRKECISEFNEHRAKGEGCDLRNADLRGLDLRGINVSGLDMSNAYLRQADLRGVDFTETRLEGASIYGAKISGTYFPKELTADELSLSLVHGIRMRYHS